MFFSFNWHARKSFFKNVQTRIFQNQNDLFNNYKSYKLMASQTPEEFCKGEKY